MRTIRRLYFYLVASISLEVVLWGVIGLLRSILSFALVGVADTLAQALALVLVGVPIFLFHWLWTKRVATHDEEEQTASLRAIFFYAVLLGTLVPVVQNLLALVDRAILNLAGISTAQAILGASQTWQDNLIAIVINLVAASYFWHSLNQAWKSLPGRDNFTDVRRLYRFLWVLYSLLMVVFGAQQTIRFVFHLPVPENVLGAVGREVFANGLALLLVGTPLWLYTWRTCQEALIDLQERESNLRLGVLYLLSLGGVITVLSAGGSLLGLILRWSFGEPLRDYEFLNQAGGPISLGLPLAVVWLYFSTWLKDQIQLDKNEPRRAGKRRFYHYFLSILGLGAAFIGVALLLSLVIDLATSSALWGQALRSRLAGSLATLIVGLPLWLLVWRPMQVEILDEGERGDHARRSILRKAYLYLALFAGVIGGMISAVWLAHTLLNALLDRALSTDFTPSLLNATQLLILFALLLGYHLRCLQRDNLKAAQTIASRHREFPVVVLFEEDDEDTKAMITAMQTHASDLPLIVQPVQKNIEKEAGSAKAVLLPAALALDPPTALRKWLKAYDGWKIVVAHGTPGWVLNGLTPAQAASCVRRLSEGEELQPSQPSATWETIKTVAVIWLGIQIFLVLLSIGISLLAG